MKPLFFAIVMAMPLAVSAGGQHEGDHGHEQGMAHGHGAHGATAHAGHASAAGRPGKPAEVSRTIRVTMNDTMRFDPAEIEVGAGETVRFLVRNDGRIRHEMVLGTAEELREHMEMMRSMPGMKHEDANMISLAPGETGEIVWQFTTPGTVEFACLVPGHYESGMKGDIRVDHQHLEGE